MVALNLCSLNVSGIFEKRFTFHIAKARRKKPGKVTSTGLITFKIKVLVSRRSLSQQCSSKKISNTKTHIQILNEFGSHGDVFKHVPKSHFMVREKYDLSHLLPSTG